MNNWLNHHLQALSLVLNRMRHHAWSTFMICLVIGVALCLPSLFYLGVDNLSKLADHMQQDTEISLFLKQDTDAATIQQIEQQLAKNDAIRHYHLVTKEEAWQQLKVKSESNQDLNGAIHALENNPLPDAFFIQAKSAVPDELETLKSALQNISGVEHALLNTEWVKRLATLLNLGEQFIFFIALLLAIVLLVIIGNTVRMQILTQKDEIEVSYLIGATNSFIRTPFLYAGMLYGLLGGLLAVAMMMFIIMTFNYSIADISHLYSSDFSLRLFNTELFITMVTTAAIIGWVGSYLAVSRAIANFKLS
ncbi:MAG: ABC transporter permease [Betaproteobacteria bacterium HGW-Betaproteobacteria-22]|nr:MAG: ABC transporter permease [Betaproteobacteria bacterium HGW-Betaproteobacteria-22]